MAFVGPREALSRAATSLRGAAARSGLPARPWWVSLRFTEHVGEYAAPHLHRDVPTGLLDALAILDAAGRDPDVAGVWLRLDAPPAGWSTALSLRRAIEQLRAQGKPVVVYAEVLDGVSLLAASAASRIWLPETGRVFLVGVRAQGVYLREFLDRFGVTPEVVRVGSHKSAGEMFTRDGMSPEQREQLEGLTDDLYGALVEGIARGRGLPDATVRDLIDRGPYTAETAVDAGLIDACVYPDQVDEALRAITPVRPDAPRRIAWVPARAYAVARSLGAADRSAPSLAYVVSQGSIARGGHGRGIGSDSVAPLLERLRVDPRCRGVVLRIDSPGGDALASDLLWRAIDRLRRDKPVVASLGEVAASGGYYMACAADQVFAELASVTGSIGVIGGKLNLEGLLERLGVGTDAVERGARAGLLTAERPFTADERRAVREEMQALYATFVARVAAGRGLSTEAVHRVAEGRVFSGRRARSVGLVDAVGGPLEALREASAQAGFAPHALPSVRVWPRTPHFAGLRTLLQWVGE
jgi:protease-4